jgi:hypothetical protein
MSTFETLSKTIKNSPSIRAMYYISLQKRITDENGLSACSEKLKEKIGENLFITLNVIQENFKWPDNNIYKQMYTDEMSGTNESREELIKNMEVWLKQYEKTYRAFEVMIDLLENYIENYKKSIMLSSNKIMEIKLLEEKINSLHDFSLTKVEGGSACLLYNDGEIVTTKSGKIYGSRSMFTSYEPLLVYYPELNLAIKEYKLSYVVLSSVELANQLREEMKNCFC